MKKQERIELLQDWVEKCHIIDRIELEKECDKYGLDEWDDVLEPMGWNCCDRCGRLGCSDYGDFLWVDNFEWEDDNPDDQATLRGIEKEKVDYCALCWNCVKELKNIGKELK